MTSPEPVAARPRGGPPGQRGQRLLFVALAVLLVGAVALPIATFLARSSDAPDQTASFDPAAACRGADREMMSGAYPELEARLPAGVAGQPPARVDSGRFCSAATLGSIFEAGITEERFAGAQWQFEGQSSLQLSVFSAPGLSVKLQADEYRRAAQAIQSMTVLAAREEQVQGRPGYRLELVRGDTREVIVVWPSADGAVVQVVIGSDLPDARVEEAVAAFH